MRLKFDGRLYSRRAVEAAAEAFREVVRFRVSEAGGVLAAEGRQEPDIDGDLEGEFRNFVLAEMAR